MSTTSRASDRAGRCLWPVRGPQIRRRSGRCAAGRDGGLPGRAQRDARGRMLQVVRIPYAKGRVEDGDGEIGALPAHVNFIIGNATVVVPTYGTATAQAAVDALKPYFPGWRKCVGLPSKRILHGRRIGPLASAQQQPESGGAPGPRADRVAARSRSPSCRQR